AGEPEPVPGVERAEVIWGLQERGENLVFGFRREANASSELVEYSPENGSSRVLSEGFSYAAFRVVGDIVYVKLPSSGDREQLVAQLSLASGALSEVGFAPTDFQQIALSGESLLFADSTRGTLSRLRPAQVLGQVLAGEQQGLVNVALDDSRIYFVSSGSILSLPR
ncbi:MAG TPA: hypothetical protein VIM73_20600, partial [Polyangiaceae bacterium]